MLVREILVNQDGFYVIPSELSGKRIMFTAFDRKDPVMLVIDDELAGALARNKGED